MTSRLLPFALLAIALTTGCATTSNTGNPPRTREINDDHVGAVERVAKSAGVRIVWINPPTRVKERRFDNSMEVKLDRNE